MNIFQERKYCYFTLLWSFFNLNLFFKKKRKLFLDFIFIFQTSFIKKLRYRFFKNSSLFFG